MALQDYGVLVGTSHRHFRDTPDDQGRWFHVHVEVDTPSGRYEGAIDVDSKHSAIGVQWRVLVATSADLDGVPDLGPGFHRLAARAGSGALDHQRHRLTAEQKGCLPGRGGRMPGRTDTSRWSVGSFAEASAALEPLLEPGRRLLVYGEPFSDGGLGVHNIHQNQGDPPGSQWWESNGIWQDGGVAAARPDGRYDLFVSRFSSQRTPTDDHGHPE